MSGYTVEFDSGVAKEFKKLDKPVAQRIARVLRQLETTPRPAGVKALTGNAGQLRIRVGDYRIVYTVKDDKLIVLVLRIAHRSAVYENL